MMRQGPEEAETRPDTLTFESAATGSEAASQEELVRLRFALEAGQLGDWDLDLTSQKVTRSLQHDKIFGYETLLPEWTLEIFMNHVHPEDRRAVEEQFRRTLETQTDLEFECRIFRAGGELAWIWVRGAIYPKAQGYPTRMLGVVRDVTGYKQAEQKLRRSETRYRALVEATNQAVWTWDPHNKTGDFADTQRWWEEITGQSPQAQSAQEQMGWLEVVHPDDRERAQTVWTRTMTTGVEYRVDYRVHAQDGSYAYIVARAVPVYGHDGTVREWVGTLINMTAKRQAEETLERERELLQKIFDRIPVMITIYRPDIQVLQLNKAFEQLTGWSTEEALQIDLMAQCYPDPEYRAQVRAYMEALQEGWRDLELTTRDGQTLESSWSNIKLSDETHIGIGIDIRERKRAEQALRQSEERLRASEAQLRALNQTLEQRVTERTIELERLVKELDQFAYVASHDLKAPLRAVNHLATWIAQDAEAVLPEASKGHLVKMQSRIQRMDRLLNDLLLYSRTGRHYYSEMSRVDTGVLVAEIIDLLAPPPGFTITVQENMPALRTNPVLLELVFRNLIDNAIKHHDKAEGRVHISAREQEEVIEFSVADDGPGIDPRFHERIFQIFQTLQSRDDVESSGVGLAIVKKAVERQHGVVSLVSAEGQGATFCFTWPKG